MRLVAKFWLLEPRRRALLIEAAANLALASAALFLLPFRRAIRLGSVKLASDHRHRSDDIVWAIEAAARRLPWRIVCIHKGIAAQRMLRRSGIDAVLHYGARHHGGESRLQAHVWVSVGGEIVIGGEEAPRFAEIAAYS